MGGRLNEGKKRSAPVTEPNGICRVFQPSGSESGERLRWRSRRAAATTGIRRRSRVTKPPCRLLLLLGSGGRAWGVRRPSRRRRAAGSRDRTRGRARTPRCRAAAWRTGARDRRGAQSAAEERSAAEETWCARGWHQRESEPRDTRAAGDTNGTSHAAARVTAVASTGTSQPRASSRAGWVSKRGRRRDVWALDAMLARVARPTTTRRERDDKT